MHNGFIGDWNRLRRKIENLIPDEVYPARLGTTDSEAVFLSLFGAGIEASPVAATTNVFYAFRYAVNDAANTLYYRTSGNNVVVVSEPLDEDHASWTAVPENSVLVAEAGKNVEILPLGEKRLQAAE
jgi:glutamine amidotransferase